ncbi:MAG: acetyl-CoA carboxylase biotin carboxyl carrier protein [Bryobacteraceae bacterium]
MRSFDDIKELIRIVRETGIGELEVQEGDYRIRISGSVPNQSVAAPVAAAAPAVPHPATARETEESRDVPVTSPIVGTYYDSPASGAPSFVKVGDRVEPKQVLCIIESMKLMNEIEAEISGTIAAKLVENGRAVEYGQTLFTIRPA